LDGAQLYDAHLNGATGLYPDINIALASVNKDPNSDNTNWQLTWTDGVVYTCDPSTGSFMPSI
jgi:hypothetical protein